MGWPQFLAWATTQGFKHIKFLRQAYRHFASTGKIPGKEVILKTAKNLYDKFIAKVPTKKIADKVRKDIKKDKLPIPKKEGTEGFKGWKPKVIEGGKSKKKVFAEDIIKKGDWDPSGMKDGGRIDKALPGRSRDI
jgi:hypothetical protein